jgi:hypothetical protein
VKYNVIVSRVSVSPRAYSSGLSQFVACGEKMRPATSDITTCICKPKVTISTVLRLTSFGQIKLLFAQIRDESKERNEASEGGTDNVEVVYYESGHSDSVLSLAVE